MKNIATDSLPHDGRFGSGPSKVRKEQLQALVESPIIGTSHRKDAVKNVVRQIQEGISTLYKLPQGYEVILGNGGSTAFWDAATFCLVEKKAQHLAFGEFGTKFAKCTDKAPFLEASEIIVSEPGSSPEVNIDTTADFIAWPHNETSTGVMKGIQRPDIKHNPLTVIDATSAAGGIDLDISQADVYYFAPQKNFGADGGLWLAIVSPAAIERIEKICSSDRWIPDFLNLKIALDESRKNQTYNTPALTNLVLLNNQIQWMLDLGGLEETAQRCKTSSALIYDWAEKNKTTEPFVQNADDRSQVVCTIDFDDSIDALEIAKELRHYGIVDIESYRKLGRNQLRIACFANIESEDIQKLLNCIDLVIDSHDS